MSAVTHDSTASSSRPPPVVFGPGSRGYRTHRSRWIRAAFICLGATAAVALLVAAAEAQDHARVGPMPYGWYAVGIQSGEYAVGTDLSLREGGQAQHGATIHSIAEAPKSFAALQQSIQAEQYRGRRVRLAAFVRTGLRGGGTGTLGSAALWMRVDGPNGTESGDYVTGRPIRQGSEWTLQEVVLDVPSDARGLSFGVLMNGAGQVWIDEASLETVGFQAPLTGRDRVPELGDLLGRPRQMAAYGLAPRQPVNLSFTEGTRSP
jgi:hypothetical protein